MSLRDDFLEVSPKDLNANGKAAYLSEEALLPKHFKISHKLVAETRLIIFYDPSNRNFQTVKNAYFFYKERYAEVFYDPRYTINE